MNNFILIVAHNNLHLTRHTINSALAQDTPCRVLVIDNASTDNTARYLAAKSGISYVTYPQQRSLAACWNAGLRCAWILGHEHALVLNCDTEIRPDSYRLLLAHGGPFVTCVSVDDRSRLNYPEPPTTERPHPDFSCFMIRRSVTDVVGWFNEECYPGYVEDSFYHTAMHQAGIKAVCIDLPFLHHGASTIKHADPVERKIIQKGADRNRLLFKKKYGCLPGSPEYYALFGNATDPSDSNQT